jgi:hypothetical protein
VRAKALRALIIGVSLCLGAAAAALAQGSDHATVVFDVTPTTAQVTAVVDPPGEVGSYHFEWGTDDSFAFKSEPIALGIEPGAREVGGTITGLTPSTNYLVRVVVTGAGDPVVGPPTAFGTPAEPTPTPTDPTPEPPELEVRDTPASDPAPSDAEQGEAVVVEAERGTVTVMQEGTNEFAELADGAAVPVGSLVDATKGTVRLISEAGDDTQTVLVRDGKFEVRQSENGSGITDLVLRGGDFSVCERAQSAGRSERRRPRRSLWARDRGGKFRTRGLNSVATVRGTTWRTTDTCRGTTTTVFAGSVLVRELRTGRRAVVRRGQRYLAPYQR